MKELDIGMTGTYINDYGFKHITDIPFSVAVDWAQDITPNSDAGLCVPFIEIVSADQWLNKLFVIVGLEHNKWIALYNHDGKFSIRTKDVT